mmetsp:Transcript_44630/g.72832  ORF Transcript_44630/g.72832 Transcript_44630/m.72832 type:complete len:625 (+) Transcript_44630:106-1980(+)
MDPSSTTTDMEEEVVYDQGAEEVSIELIDFLKGLRLQKYATRIYEATGVIDPEEFKDVPSQDWLVLDGFMKLVELKRLKKAVGVLQPTSPSTDDGQKTPMRMLNDVCFPCIEMPLRCFLTSRPHDQRLSSRPDGTIFCSRNPEAWEEWLMLRGDGPHANEVKLISRSHQTLLVMKPDGYTTACSEQSMPEDYDPLWKIRRSADGGFSLSSVHHGRYLSFKGSRQWNIEFQTGELCFISNPHYDKRVKCGMSGSLEMTHNWKGWEVFRFIEAGDGDVRITSWTHKEKVLCADQEGHVLTTENLLGDWGKWRVESAPDGAHGVVIKSVSHGTYLSSCGERLYASPQFEHKASTWHLESAHSQNYFISCAAHDKRISTSDSSPFTSPNRGAREEWKVGVVEMMGEDNLITLKNCTHGKFLTSNEDGFVCMADHVGPDQVWKARHSPHGGIFMISNSYNRCLACNDDGHLYTVPFEDHQGTWETWSLEPKMPHTFSKEQKKKWILTGSLIAASAMMVPLGVVGIIGAMGFTAEGIAAGSVAAGMMSAEAIAAGGGVLAGGTVATLQSIGAVGLGLAGTSVAMGAGAVIGATTAGIVCAVAGEEHFDADYINNGPKPSEKRPFCNWRVW